MTLDERVTELALTVTKVEERSKSNTYRLEEHDDMLKENTTLITSIKELAVETKYMREDLNKTVQRLTKLEDQTFSSEAKALKDKNEELKSQADKWEKFKWLIIAGVVSIILSLLATTLNLK